MCEQLPALALSLGRRQCAAVILPEVLELAEDEERAVRCAAIRALGSILHLLPPELRRARAFPFVRGLCAAAEISAEVQRCVARLFCGQLIQARRLLHLLTLRVPFLARKCMVAPKVTPGRDLTVTSGDSIRPEQQRPAKANSF